MGFMKTEKQAAVLAEMVASGTMYLGLRGTPPVTQTKNDHSAVSSVKTAIDDLTGVASVITEIADMVSGHSLSVIKAAVGITLQLMLTNHSDKVVGVLQSLIDRFLPDSDDDFLDELTEKLDQVLQVEGLTVAEQIIADELSAALVATVFGKFKPSWLDEKFSLREVMDLFGAVTSAIGRVLAEVPKPKVSKAADTPIHQPVVSTEPDDGSVSVRDQIYRAPVKHTQQEPTAGALTPEKVDSLASKFKVLPQSRAAAKKAKRRESYVDSDVDFHGGRKGRQAK